MTHEHLVGLPWQHGRQDCFELVRRFYRDNFGIEIADYARPSDWDSDVIDLMRYAPVEEGFEMITQWRPSDIRPWDIFCMSIGSRNANHLAIYLGNNQFLHHLYGRLSNVEDFRDFWLSRINYILRHPDVPVVQAEKQDTDISRLLRERYQTKAD